VEFVLVLHDLERPEVVQVFGPYPSEQDADLALADLAEWPMLHGSWETRPLHRYMAPAAPVVPSPSLPFYPAAPIYPSLPAPQWPTSPIWCDVANPAYTTFVGPPPAVNYTFTWPASTPGNDEPPPDIAVPARI
jgi:hypothetical protein